MIRNTPHRRLRLKSLVPAVALASASLMPGCFTYHRTGGAAPPPERLADHAFASRATPRETQRLDAFAESLAPGTFAGYELIPDAAADPDQAARYRDRLERHTLKVLAIDRREDGLFVRVAPYVLTGLDGEELEIVGDDPLVRRGFFGDDDVTIAATARYLSARRLSQLDATERLVGDERERLGEPRLKPPPSELRFGEHRLLVERLRDGIDITTPLNVDSGAAGLVVYLPAMFTNIYEYRVVQEFRDRGWAMLYLDASPRVEGPSEPQRDAVTERRGLLIAREFLAVWQQTTAAQLADEQPDPISPWETQRRIRERVEAEHPLPPTGFEWSPGRDPDQLGMFIAGAVDAALLEYADAAHAALDDLLEREPHLADKPVVVLGFSGGSLVAPAVAAKLRREFDLDHVALVLVGGGGDILSIALDSTLTAGGLNVADDDQPLPSEVRERLVAAYRQHSTLDPLRVIASLRDVPLFKVYANDDEMVPTAAARALIDAHGGADRLVFNGKHMPLFYFLPGQKERIANWVGRTLVGER